MKLSVFSQKASGIGQAVKMPNRIVDGTKQQQDIWTELSSGNQDHVVIEARAGCGKSSTCREAMWKILDEHKSRQIRYAVFSRANADEFRLDCPTGVEVATLHSFGLSALRTHFGSHPEKMKTYVILDSFTVAKNLPRYMRRSISHLVAQAKSQMLKPDQEDLPEILSRLMILYDINGYGREKLIIDLSMDVLEQSAKWVEVADFDDMIWLPVLHDVSFPHLDFFFVDECQDLNPAQQALLRLAKKNSRVICVGDRYQAIYAFRGADSDSIPNLERMLSEEGLRQFPLNVTFRCPKRHVRLAQHYVDDIRAHESAPDGEVEEGWSLENAYLRYRPGDFVICPTNAPVIQQALKLIAMNVPVIVRGRAVGDSLASIVRSLGRVATTAQLASGVEKWRNRELLRLSDLDDAEELQDQVNDRANGLMAVIQACSSPAEVEPAIARLFTDEADFSKVVFSTVHRAKGLEADTVWYLDLPQRSPKREWETRQQKNLRYVALTRSKHRLCFVEPEEEQKGE